jgi:hypothetical protein
MFQQQKRRDLMGGGKKEALRVQFDPSVKMEFHGAKLTSDGGLTVCRELDEVLGLITLAEEVLPGSTHGSEHQHTLTALLGQAGYGRLPDTKIPTMPSVYGSIPHCDR